MLRITVALLSISAVLAGCAAPSDHDADAATKDRTPSDPFAATTSQAGQPRAITPTTLPPPTPAPAQTYTGFVLAARTIDGTPYFLASDGTRNPTLLVPAGEEIAIDLARHGETHALTVNGVGIIGAGTDDVRGFFRAPAEGSVGYDCPIHPGTMRGTIAVA